MGCLVGDHKGSHDIYKGTSLKLSEKRSEVEAKANAQTIREWNPAPLVHKKLLAQNLHRGPRGTSVGREAPI